MTWASQGSKVGGCPPTHLGRRSGGQEDVSEEVVQTWLSLPLSLPGRMSPSTSCPSKAFPVKDHGLSQDSQADLVCGPLDFRSSLQAPLLS